MTANDEQLDKLVQRRNTLIGSVQRIEGRKEAATANLAAAEEACRKRKVDPENIDSYIERLENMYDEKLAELKSGIEDAEKKLAPFTGDANED